MKPTSPTSLFFSPNPYALLTKLDPEQNPAQENVVEHTSRSDKSSKAKRRTAGEAQLRKQLKNSVALQSTNAELPEETASDSKSYEYIHNPYRAVLPNATPKNVWPKLSEFFSRREVWAEMFALPGSAIDPRPDIHGYKQRLRLFGVFGQAAVGVSMASYCCWRDYSRNNHHIIYTSAGHPCTFSTHNAVNLMPLNIFAIALPSAISLAYVRAYLVAEQRYRSLKP